MPDNGFEKNMSRQMEDFSYTPSDAVWQKLESELRTRKKKRRGFIWFFSGILILSMGLYFYTREVPPMAVISPKEKSAPGAEAGISKNEVPLPSIQDPVDPGYGTPDNVYTKNEDGIHENSRLRDSSNPDPVYTGNKIAVNRNRKALVKSTDKAPLKSATEKKEIDPKELSAIVIRVPESVYADHSERDMTIQAPANIDWRRNDNRLNFIGSQKTTDPNSLDTLQNKRVSTKSTLSFGIRLEAGASANSDISIGQAKSADLAYTPGSVPMPVYYPYAQEPLFAWSLGAWMRVPIRQKLSAVTGLSYHQYRTGTAVGMQGQGSMISNPGTGYRMADPYFLPGNANTYVNKYHLLSLPLEIHVQLNKGDKLPVSWSLGAEPGWMFSSNALIKKDSSGILYSDKNMYNRFQMGIQTGISFRIFNKGKHPVELGPVFQYMITPALKKEAGYSGHLSFIGIRGDWTLFSSGSKQR